MTHYHEGWLHDYENSSDFYDESLDTSTDKWDIKTLPPLEGSLPSERKDFEDVRNASSLEEAIKAYAKHYSWEKIEKGHQSPQQAAEMLHLINDTYAETMTPKQCHGLALEIISMSHAIGRLADRPVGDGDRTSFKGLMEIAYSISVAQAHAPEEVASLEEDLHKVASKVEGRLEHKKDYDPSASLSGPILEAVEEFERLSPAEQEMTDFKALLVKIDHAKLNDVDKKAAEKAHSLRHTKYNHSKRSAESTQIGVGTQTHFSTGIATLSKIPKKGL